MTLILGLLWLLLVSCSSSIYPVTTGAHVHQQPWGLSTDRYVVWANDPRVAQLITAYLLKWPRSVVERARLQQIFDEQKITLLHTPDDAKTVLRVGRLVGASHVMFIESEVRPARPGDNSAGFYVNVALRNVAIESGEVKWSGTAQFAERTSTPDIAVIQAANWAFIHATCEIENGYTWNPPPVGCAKREANRE